MNALRSLAEAPPLHVSFELIKFSKPTVIAVDDPLVPLVTSQRILLYPEYHRNGLKYSEPVLCVRRSVKNRLELAASLLPPTVALKVMDAWRSAQLQREVFDFFNSKLPASVDRDKYVFNPAQVGVPKSYPTDFPPHRTGGAVDVVLANQQGDPLSMGVSFDEMSPLACTAAFEENDCGFAPNEALLIRCHRRTLVYVMSNAGFSNYPEEYWHYDFGNSFWRHYSKIDCQTVFGCVD